MKRLTCEMCGSTEVVKQDGLFVCQSCGTKYAVEEARKMMLEGTVDVSGSTVKVDTSQALENLYLLARRAKKEEDRISAQKYYEQILLQDPSSWEASFYTVYYQAMNSKVGEIGDAATRVTNCEETVFTLIRDNLSGDAQRQAVEEVAQKLTSLSGLLFTTYKKYYDQLTPPQARSRHTGSYAKTCSLCRDMVYTAGNTIDSMFGALYGDIAASCWKLGVREHNILNGVFPDKNAQADIIQAYNEKIKQYDPAYRPPMTNMVSDGPCYVATAVYGSYDCPPVWTLRRFRDEQLARSAPGRAFIRVYYALSPTLVRWFGRKRWFQAFWRKKLDRLVSRLHDRGVADTPYVDKTWKT